MRKSKLQIIVSEAMYRSIIAFIKPGCIHRFSGDLEVFDNLLSLTNFISQKTSEIYDKVQKLKKGEITLNEIELTKTVYEISKDFYGWNEKSSEYTNPIIITTTLQLYSYLSKGKGFSDIRTLMRYMSGEQLLPLYDAFIVTESKEKSILEDRYLTKRKVVEQNITLEEIIEILKDEMSTYKFVTDIDTVNECHKIIIKSNQSNEKINSSIIKGYLYLLSSYGETSLKNKINSILEENGMETRQGAKLLYELDLQLKKQKKEYNYLIVPLISCTLEAFLQGAKPP